MSRWGLCILLLLPVLAHTQILHSIDRMTKAIELQEVLADQLETHILEEEKRLQMLQTYIKYLRTARKERNITRSDLEAQMSHPVRVFRFITEMYTEIDDIRQSVDMSRISPELKETFDNLPSQKDYTDAVGAVTRLQEVYKDAADFTKPQEDNFKDVLTAEEIFDIGKVSAEQKNFFGALNNLKKAKEMFEERNDIPQAMAAFDYLAYVMYEQENTDYALNYTYELLDYYKDKDEEVVLRLTENIKLYIDDLGGEEQSKEQLNLTTPYKNEPTEEFPNYNQLCRGERVEVELNDTKPQNLKCYLYTNNNNPLLILSPAKKEELNVETGLSYFHEVLTDTEIKLLQEKAGTRFEDSQLVPEDEMKNDPNIQLEDEHGYADTRVRSSNTGWVEDDVDSRIAAISKRISAILSLTLDSAESFQVLSYGIGGFYLPHFDWGQGEQPFADFDGNRIATWIFYLNDIKKGGATVFPEIGATVWPSKGGAAFWRNLHKNGEGNPLTLHAACPVLEGYKWASNKWFHTIGNELSWPCGLDPEV